MKNHLLTFLFLISFSVSFAQDYINEIATKTCEHLTKMSDTLSGDQFNLELGIYMIEASLPYKEQLKKDFNIDFEKIDVQGDELGRLIGLKMATICPTTLLKMVEKQDEESNEVAEITVEGTITKIEDTKFVEFSVKDLQGKTSKFYWLSFIDSNIELVSEYKNLKNKNIRISYFTQDIYDARINEYHAFNIITRLAVLE